MNIYTNKKYCVYLTVYYGNKMPMYYIGSSSVDKVQQGYRGSVASIKYRDIWVEEIANNPNLFKTFIVKQFTDRKDATDYEHSVQRKLDVIRSPMYINQSYATIHGFCGMDVSGKNNPNYNNHWSYKDRGYISKSIGKSPAICRSTGKKIYVSVSDPRWKTGEIHGHLKGKQNKKAGIVNVDMIVCKDENEVIHRVSVDDNRVKDGTLRHHTTGTKTVINKNTGKKTRIKLSEYNEKIHLENNVGTLHARDENNNHYIININDPRLLSEELVVFSKGKVTVKDKEGKTFSVDKTDPRYISGELVHHTKGTKNAYDTKTGSHLGRISIQDPRWATKEVSYKKPN